MRRRRHRAKTDYSLSADLAPYSSVDLPTLQKRAALS
jgi:hypothetical protein